MSARILVHGSAPAHPAGAAAVQALHPDHPLRVTVVLEPGQPEAVPAVEAFARDHGLEVVEISAVQGDVVLAGSASQLSRAFGISLRHYDHPRGRYHGHEEPVSLPGSLEGLVLGVLGLDTIPHGRRHVAPVHPSGAPLRPAEVAERYRFPAMPAPGTARVAVLEFGGGFHAADLTGFLKAEGLLPPPIRVLSAATSGAAPLANAPLDAAILGQMARAWREGAPAATIARDFGSSLDAFLSTTEVSMDVQLLAALAPGVPLDVWFVRPDADSWRRALLGLLPSGRTDGGAAPPWVVSISWGESEAGWGPMKLRTLDHALAQLAEAGVTVCCSSGDSGSRVAPGPDAARGIEFPAASPNVLACGGTAMNGPAETAWKETLRTGALLAGGGGMSGWFPRPPHQDGIAAAAAPDTWRAKNGADHAGRWIPDVAALAAFTPGYAIELGGEAFTGGGTSAATPVWAALLTRIALNTGRPLGRVAPLLYSLAGTAALRDVVSGDNDPAPPATGSPHYAAGPGWDACTGLGIPDGTSLLAGVRRLLPAS